MSSVIQEWLFNNNISMKQQSVVLAALRGCDGQPYNDISKEVVRKIRSTILKNAADERTTFMQQNLEINDVIIFAKSRNKYPVHFYMHICHCCEVIGFKHPNPDVRKWFYKAYLILVKSLYLNPETESECDERLNDGKTTKFEDFAKIIAEL